MDVAYLFLSKCCFLVLFGTGCILTFYCRLALLRYVFLYYIGCDIVCRAVSFLSAGDVLLSVGDTLFPFGDMVRSRLGVIFIRQVFSVVGISFRRMQRGKRIGGAHGMPYLAKGTTSAAASLQWPTCKKK